MKNLLFPLVIVLFFSTIATAQDIEYTVANIPAELKENANAVVRLDQKNIVIASRKSMITTTKSIVTVLNENGLSYMNLSEYFSGRERIKSIEAQFYNAFGKEIKKVKRKDFKENSVSGNSIISDGKILYYDYTPIEYPFTVVFSSETETSNTAFMPRWFPVPGFSVSVEKSNITIKVPSDLGFKYKEFNMLDNPNITKEVKSDGVSFTANNMVTYKAEEYSPSFDSYSPNVMMGLDFFNLEGVDGTAKSWAEMGKWFSDKILAGTSELPEETKVKIKALIGDEKDPLKKAKIVYGYVQEKVRYISIQEGIGGWRPMLAKDVDRLGYGDCKALTNYTKSLLDAVGVQSYYVRLYGDRNKKSVIPDLVSMQSNHVILAIPDKEKYVWLECTSQTLPFGFQGDFTDDRNALVLKPEGGEIVRTNVYETKDNTQITKGNYSVSDDGMISGKLEIKSKGIQYDKKLNINEKSVDDLKKIYKNYFSHINNLKIIKTDILNDKDNIEFTEKISLEAAGYANKTGDRLIFALNAYNPSSSVPQRYRNRTNPFEISRGFYDYDEVTIDLPKGFVIEAKPENTEIKSAFGDYKTEYVILNENQLIYKRTYQINSGQFDKKDYENFRKFKEQIAKNDNAKIALVKKQ
ncbi:DUF3857 domain-containing protein [Flavobacterium microcysteis]|uniref:DUF3857 domain-containing protein n=1 Tax=Flavobacterium microcysteis TaxID=2596891 RepID=A0A501Q5R3_9FLAO|nr:DUF3857 domain-containing protein [Flavobacterium microcysteis]TPD68230.1 DUF3857 domain-containing protein [Flavobacterium microcysteis]